VRSPGVCCCGSPQSDATADLKRPVKRVRLVNATGETKEMETELASGDSSARFLSVPLKESSPPMSSRCRRTALPSRRGEGTDRGDRCRAEEARETMQTQGAGHVPYEVTHRAPASTSTH